MATEVFTTEDIKLLDGEEVELRPLPIAKMRKFMRIWAEHTTILQKLLGSDSEEEFNQVEITDGQYTAFINMCALSLESQLKGEKSDKQFRDYLENTLDEQTIFRILKVTGGLELGNQASPATTMNQAAAGTN